MMKLAILYEDDEIMVSYSEKEFVKELSLLVEKQGKTIKKALEIMVNRLKKKTQKA